MSWQHIATAPADGEEILATDGRRVWIASYWSGAIRCVHTGLCLSGLIAWQEVPALPAPRDLRQPRMALEMATC